MDRLALVFAGWLAATLLLTTLFLDWTGSLFVAVPAALCVSTGAALLLVRPGRR
jgi:hypothetical protein